MHTLKVENLKKTFFSEGKKVEALKGISFEAKKGEIIGFLGPNGAGKTTTISILTGLLEKDSGKVTMIGNDVDKNLDRIKSRINIVSGFSMISTDLTVYEVLNYYSILYSIKDKKKKIDEVIEIADLTSKRDHIARDLSSGFKQRLWLAKSLLNDPEILFLDEPTVGLDVEIAIKIREIISRLAEKGTTIILTSHNMYEIELLCDRIILINDGKVIAKGSLKEIKSIIPSAKILKVECRDNQKLSAHLAKMKEVKKLSKVDHTITLEFDGKDTNTILTAVTSSGSEIESIVMVEPTLEETFLKLVKR